MTNGNACPIPFVGFGNALLGVILREFIVAILIALMSGCLDVGVACIWSVRYASIKRYNRPSSPFIARLLIGGHSSHYMFSEALSDLKSPDSFVVVALLLAPPIISASSD